MKPKDLSARRKVTVLSCALFLSLALAASLRIQAQPASDPLPQFWRTDAPVYAIAVTNDMAYIGGDFTYVGPSSGPLGLLDSEFGQPLSGLPKLTGTVRAIASDTTGGWYIGGAFTAGVGSSAPKNLIHIGPDNNIDYSFRPDPDGTVRTLLWLGNGLVAGGEFYTIANTQNSYLAFLDPATGQTNGTRIRANNTVSALVRDGDTLYIGGAFSGITTFSGSQPINSQRQRLAAVKPSTGEILDWNPSSTGGYEGVRALAVTATTVYVGGDFTYCGNKPRNGIASVNKTDGTANTWNPNAQFSGGTPSVNALAVIGNVVYAGGDFTGIGARNRVRLAALQSTGFGQADANWQVDANDVVTFLLPLGNDLLVGGRFTVIGGSIDYATGQPVQTGGTARKGLARISAGAVQDWGPEVSLLLPPWSYYANATCWAAAQQNDRFLLGGDFLSFGGVRRARIAALDLKTGAATGWAPEADNSVRAIVTAPQGIYVGGYFATIAGQPRARLALLKYLDATADDWDAKLQAGQFISAIAVTPSSVLAGGNFTKIGGQDRYNLAELERGSGNATAWNPQPGGAVNVLLYSDGQVYVGGNYYGISGGNQQFLALLTMKTDPAAQWIKAFNPQADGQIRALALDAGRLYVAGDFTKISGQDRKSVAAISPTTGHENDPLDVQLTGQGQLQARAILPLGQALYMGGTFRGAGGENRGRLASVHNAFGAATGWDPGADGAINAIARTSELILAGGEFTRLGMRGANPGSTDGQAVTYFAAFSARPSLSNLRKNTAGHYTFNVADGDGLGSTLQVQWSDKITGGTWQTIQTSDVLGVQDPVEDTSALAPHARFYRLVRQP